jgi:hypothetical protein
MYGVFCITQDQSFIKRNAGSNLRLLAVVRHESEANTIAGILRDQYNDHTVNVRKV